MKRLARETSAIPKLTSATRANFWAMSQASPSKKACGAPSIGIRRNAPRSPQNNRSRQSTAFSSCLRRVCDRGSGREIGYGSRSSSEPAPPAAASGAITICGTPASFIFLFSAANSSSTSFFTLADPSVTSGFSSAIFYIFHQAGHLVRQRCRTPFEGRTGIPQPFPFADIFLHQLIHLFLQLFSLLLNVFRNLQAVLLRGFF